MPIDKNCPICNMDRKKREKIESLVKQGISKESISAKYKFTVTNLTIHMRHHLDAFPKIGRPRKNPPEPDSPKARELIIEKFRGMTGEQILNEMVPKLAERLNYLLSMSPESSSANKQISMLIESLRRACMSIAELRGDLQSEARITIIQYNELRALVLKELPPQYQQKILKKLGAIDADTIRTTNGRDKGF